QLSVQSSFAEAAQLLKPASAAMTSDMIRYFREDLYRRFLSVDFKKQVDGLEMLCVGLVYKVSIGAACNFLWAVDRLVIQVLDDSTEPAIKVIVTQQFLHLQ
ncbi:hypothetical protein S83_019705, partial [Arachis hypogaea]